MNSDLKIIKKKYGENMMKLCRELFPTILENDKVLSKIMLDNFDPSHSLYDDICSCDVVDDFKNYIYSLFEQKKEKNLVLKTPKELLEEAGYNLYECHNEDEIQSFKKYYSEGEDLCTFRGNRLNRCYVFFAVKKDVDKIKREDFKNPERQDLYGTSVISIQFTKDRYHTLSIKNRYNHVVENPDATFSNNLDNIILGLTESFEKEYGLVQKNRNNSFELLHYVRANDGKYYKYNYEINNIYYCTNNTIIDNFEVKKYEKDKFLIFDYFILDLKNKKIYLYDDFKDPFIYAFDNTKKIEVIKENRNKKIIFKTDQDDIVIKINEENKMTEYINNNILIADNNFLFYNLYLLEINIPNMKKIGNSFLYNDELLKKIDVLNVKTIGHDFLRYNSKLEKISLSKVNEIGSYFLNSNNALEEISLPKVEEIGDCFLSNNNALKEIKLPVVKEIGDYFLSNNSTLKEISLPKVEEIGDCFLRNNNTLEEINLPKVEEIDSNFLNRYRELIETNLQVNKFKRIIKTIRRK